MGSAGGTPTELIPNAYDPAWSPDGNYIAFVSDLPGPPPRYAFLPDPNAVSIYVWDNTHINPPANLSRYVFYLDGTFHMQCMTSTGAIYALAGKYVRAGSEVIFNFDANSPQRQAGGLFRENDSALLVGYNEVMTMDDFEGGIYTLLSRQSAENPIKEPDEPQPEPDPPPEQPPGESLEPPPRLRLETWD